MSEKILTFLERVEMNLPVTAQEVFDQSVGGVIRQGRQSVGGDGMCLYRDSQGGACAYGQCIPDSLYTPDMEHNGITSLADVDVEIPESLVPHLDLLEALQLAHDSDLGPFYSTWLDTFKSRAGRVANRHNLVWIF
jgi:hypothetical protein